MASAYASSVLSSGSRCHLGCWVTTVPLVPVPAGQAGLPPPPEVPGCTLNPACNFRLVCHLPQCHGHTLFPQPCCCPTGAREEEVPPRRDSPGCPRGCCRPGPVLLDCPGVVAPPPPWHTPCQRLTSAFLSRGPWKVLMGCELLWAPLLPGGWVGSGALWELQVCREVTRRAGEGRLSLVALVGWRGRLSRSCPGMAPHASPEWPSSLGRVGALLLERESEASPRTEMPAAAAAGEGAQGSLPGFRAGGPLPCASGPP